MRQLAGAANARAQLEKKLTQATNERDFLKEQLQTLQRDVASKGAERSSLLRDLHAWKVWWSRLRDKAPPAFMCKLKYYTRPPPTARDR